MSHDDPAPGRTADDSLPLPIAPEEAIERALATLDLETKVHVLTGANFWELYAAPQIGLRSIVVSDGPAGVKGGGNDMTSTTTSLPSPTALSASWDEGLIGELGALLAAEARRKGVDVLLGPTINLHRSPFGGRHFEQFSEDPLLTGRMAVAYIRGLQSNGVGGCAKHYVCNDSETERHTYSAVVAERPLHEVYLAPFERAVREAETWTVMASYNRVAGVQMTESPLLADPLKERWDWDGLVMSDWYATHSTAAAARAALDLVMPGPPGPWGDSLLAAVRAGEVAEAAIDEKVRRLLRLAARVGALDGVSAAAAVVRPRTTGEIAALVRRASAAGSVLLRNDGVLPIDGSRLRRVALLGPNAALPPGQGGGSANLRPDYTVTPLAGLRQALPADVEILTNPADLVVAGLHPLDAGEALLPAEAGNDAGKPGILVRVVDTAGDEIGRRVRADGELNWVGNPWFTGRPVVEVATLVRSPVAGRHRIGFAARGHVTLWLGGRRILDTTVMPEKPDVDSIWHQAPVHLVEVDLEPGRPVEFRARWEKFYDESGVFLRLLLEKPAPTREQALERAAELAAAADVAVVLVGSNKEDETEGQDRSSLSLARGQDELVERVVAANPRTVVVLSVGAPVLMPWRHDVAAILLNWFPGQEAGNALADMLLGAVEPGGRLPTTWPDAAQDVPVLDTQPVDGELRYGEGIHVGHRGWLRRRAEPAFWFGHGLGYTAWEYLDATADVRGGPPAVASESEPHRQADSAGGAAGGGDGAAEPGGRAGRPGGGESDSPAVRVRLRNVGGRAGREVVQLYLSRPGSALERPVRWLAGYAAVEAAPGEEVEVVVPVDPWALRHWDVGAAGGAGDWASEAGRYEVAVGRSAGDLRLHTSIELR